MSKFQGPQSDTATCLRGGAGQQSAGWKGAPLWNHLTPDADLYAPWRDWRFFVPLRWRVLYFGAALYFFSGKVFGRCVFVFRLQSPKAWLKHNFSQGQCKIINIFPNCFLFFPFLFVFHFFYLFPFLGVFFLRGLRRFSCFLKYCIILGLGIYWGFPHF